MRDTPVSFLCRLVHRARFTQGTVSGDFALASNAEYGLCHAWPGLSVGRTRTPALPLCNLGWLALFTWRQHRKQLCSSVLRRRIIWKTTTCLSPKGTLPHTLLQIMLTNLVVGMSCSDLQSRYQTNIYRSKFTKVPRPTRDTNRTGLQRRYIKL